MTRNELNEMVALAERLQAAAEPATLATLFAASGSTYRPLGSMMLAGPSMAFTVGSVSGGCLEEYIVRRGRTLTEKEPAVVMRFNSDPDADTGDMPALGCGGSIDMLIERFAPAHIDFLRRFAQAYNSDAISTAVCIVDASNSPHLAIRRSVWIAGDHPVGGDAELESLRKSAVRLSRSAEGSIGPRQQALVHFIRPTTRLVIFGAGNDAKPLCSLGRSLGWHVCVADRRARLATRGRFPDADQIVAADWPAALSSITFTPQTALVLMTHSVADDAELLPLLADRPTAYVGMLGPERRRRWLLENVEDAADLPEAFVSRIRGPIGLDLGERSPAGIAVSIVSQILAELNGRNAVPLSLSNKATTVRPSRISVPIPSGCSFYESHSP